jgi:hypothetical protein
MRFLLSLRTSRIFAIARLPWFLFGVALVSVPAFAARDQWRTTRTDHFEVFSAASEKQTRQLVVQLEQFRASFIGMFGLRPAHEPRVTVMLFNSDRLFTPYKPTYNGRPKEVSGYFVGGTDEVVIALNTDTSSDDFGDPAEIVFHEYVHLLLHTRGLRLPLWLNEGLAELFSTFRVSGETVEYGHPKDHYVYALNSGATMSMAKMMAVTESSPEYNEEHRAGLFYAQSWALAHFLVWGEDRKNAARISRYINLVGEPPTGNDVTFAEVFGPDFAKLGEKLRAYLEGGRYYQRRGPVPLKGLAAKIAVRAATELERDFALLNLRWRVHRSGDSMLAALKLAEKYPESPRPRELLASIAANSGDVPRAFERWQEAAERNTENPFVYVHGARSKLMDIGLLAHPDDRLSDSDSTQLRQWLDRAGELSPLYEDVVEMLALVEARSPQFRVAVVNQIQLRVAQLKDPNPTLLALAIIRWRADDIATANSITKAVLDSSIARPETKAAARLLQLRFSEPPGVQTTIVSPVRRSKAPPSILDRSTLPTPSGADSELPTRVGSGGTFIDRLESAAEGHK